MCWQTSPFRAPIAKLSFARKVTIYLLCVLWHYPILATLAEVPFNIKNQQERPLGQ